MVNTSAHHGWSIPEVGGDEDQWGDYINETLEALDQEVIIKNEFSLRPGAGSEGRWFLATDQGTLYYDNGSSWEQIIGQNMPDTSFIVDRILASAGSESSPTHTFDGDTDTGIFSPGANQLGIATGGNEAFRVQTDQHAVGYNGLTAVAGSSGDTSTPVDRATHSSALYASGGDNGIGLLITPGGDPTGQDESAIEWMTRDAERVGRMSAAESSDALTLATRDGTAYDGSTGSYVPTLVLNGGSNDVAIPNGALDLRDNRAHGLSELGLAPVDYAVGDEWRTTPGPDSPSDGNETLSVSYYDDSASSVSDVLELHRAGDVHVSNGDLVDGDGNVIYDLSNNEVPEARIGGSTSGGADASGIATLSSGSATVSTGITSTGTHIDVSLDPSGDGANSSNVKVAARAFWDNGAGEYKVELIEDGTAVGNPDVGWEVYAS